MLGITVRGARKPFNDPLLPIYLWKSVLYKRFWKETNVMEWCPVLLKPDVITSLLSSAETTWVPSSSSATSECPLRDIGIVHRSMSCVKSCDLVCRRLVILLMVSRHLAYTILIAMYVFWPSRVLRCNISCPFPCFLCGLLGLPKHQTFY